MVEVPLTMTALFQVTKIRQRWRGSSVHHACSVTPTGSALATDTETGWEFGSRTALPPNTTAFTVRTVRFSMLMTPSAFAGAAAPRTAATMRKAALRINGRGPVRGKAAIVAPIAA